MSNKTKAIVAILLSSLFGGAVGTVTKISITSIPPFSFSFIRFFIASICLLPLFIKQKPIFKKDVFKLILLSFLPTLNIAFFVSGIKETTASVAQLLYAGTPLIAGFIGYIIYRNELTIKRTLYIAIGLLGVFIVIFLPLIQKNNTSVGNFNGNILISIAVICWSFYAVLSKEYQKKYSPLILTSIFCFTATVILFLLSLVEARMNGYEWLNNLNHQAVFGLFYVSIIGTVCAYLLNQFSIKFTDAVLGSLNMYLMPIIAYLFAYLLLGEKLHAGLIIGTVLVFISVGLTTYSKTR